MSTVTIEEAQAKLPELIEQLGIGDEIVITRGAHPVAKLVPPVVEGKPLVRTRTRQTRRFGGRR
jgi:antitoxin (DNA-binding transcriptional repressor) of toxin-antitoxin stability system